MDSGAIRRAQPRDAEVVSDLSARTFTAAFGHLYPPADLAAFVQESYGLERTRRDLADPGIATWLLEVDGVAVGYALAGPCGLPHPEVTPGSGELKRIYLLPQWQGGGRGSALLETALNWLEATMPGPIWIGVWSQNIGAQKLYARLGFDKVGEYEFKVGATRDHEFIMRRG